MFYRKNGWLVWVLCFFAPGALKAEGFSVTTAAEFQAALTIAAGNEADDEIVIEGEIEGAFIYRTDDRGSLTLKSADANQRASLRYGYLALILETEVSAVTLEGLDLFNFRLGYATDSQKVNQLSFVDVHQDDDGAIRPSNELFFDTKSVVISDSSIRGAIWSHIEFLSMSDSSLSFTTFSVTNIDEMNISSSTLNVKIASGKGDWLIDDSIVQARYTMTTTAIRASNSFLELIPSSGYGPPTLGQEKVEFNNVRLKGLHRATLRGDVSIVSSECLSEIELQVDGSAPSGINNDIVLRGNSGCGFLVRNAESVQLEKNVSEEGVSIYGPVSKLVARDNLLLSFYSEALTNSIIGNTIQIQLWIRSNGEAVVANNIVWGIDRWLNPRGAVEIIGFPETAVLKHNIFREQKGFWSENVGNLVVDPKFHNFESGDYRLALDSPAVDTGTNDVITDPAATDLDGSPRIINGKVDIGAYERNTAPLHPADTNEDSVISLDEFNAYNAAWRTNQTWQGAPSIITADFVTRAGYLLQRGGEYKNIGAGKPQTWVPVNE